MNIKVGIFWIIKGNVYSKIQEKCLESEREEKNVMITGFIDSDYGHFSEWDLLCANKFPNADFATFPRGRVMFDIKRKENVIYADECITEKEIKRIVEIFDLSKYRTEKDEHYTCDKCIKIKGDIFL